ncbi:MAG: hypothetical protein MJK15_03190 [Colwellia sp.]|nr:hypothetical protein [Colwellia sp.]
MTFEATRKQPTQEHFYIIEIDLPIITGKCEETVGVEGFGTPLSCPIQDVTSATVIKTYRFCTPNTPILPIAELYRHVTNVAESATELQVDVGLAIRGRATISFEDFSGLDPNSERARGVASRDNGTFFGKFKDRNVIEGREVRVIKYRKSNSLDVNTDGQTAYYTARKLSTSDVGKYRLECVDELARIEFDQAQIPPEQESFLRLDIDDSVTAIPVDSVTDWNQISTPYVVRIGDEYQTVTAVTDNQTATASLTVKTRGDNVGAPEFTNTLTRTVADDHSAGDDVYICTTFDDENIATALETLLLSVEVPSSIIPIADWLDEVAEWHPSDKVNGVYDESVDADESIIRILEPYLMQMWFDPIAREIKLKAISQWLVSSSTVTEGKEIDFNSLKIADVEELRYSRAFISYDKPFLANNEDAQSYKKTSVAIRPELETVEFYGTKPKSKKFKSSTLINKGTADLLTSRYVQSFGMTPQKYSWKTQERNLNFDVGDVVNVFSPRIQGFDGLPSENTRAQILRIQPKFTKTGREYDVSALSYQPAITSGAVFVINNATELNLFIFAGAPSTAVDVTFIFDGGIFNSTDNNIPAVRAGGFAAGSTIIIILRNAADWSAKGGKGGNGQALVWSPGVDEWAALGGLSNGENAGIVYDAQGIDTEIYLSGADPESGTAEGFLRAPSGGSGGFVGFFVQGIESSGIGGDGGDGGDGINPGVGGFGGVIVGTALATPGDAGSNGQTDGTGTGFGVDGVDNDALKGIKGDGIIKNGANVKVFGSTPLNFINGGGDTPDV